MREGLEKGFPVKLLLIGLISEFLELGFDGSEEDLLLLLEDIDSKLNWRVRLRVF